MSRDHPQRHRWPAVLVPCRLGSGLLRPDGRHAPSIPAPLPGARGPSADPAVLRRSVAERARHLRRQPLGELLARDRLTQGAAHVVGLASPGSSRPPGCRGRGWSGTRSPPRMRRRPRRRRRPASRHPRRRAARGTPRATTRSRSTVSIARPKADETCSRFAIAAHVGRVVGAGRMEQRGVEEDGIPLAQGQLHVVAHEVLLELPEPVREVAVRVLLAVREIERWARLDRHVAVGDGALEGEQRGHVVDPARDSDP